MRSTGSIIGWLPRFGSLFLVLFSGGLSGVPQAEASPASGIWGGVLPGGVFVSLRVFVFLGAVSLAAVSDLTMCLHLYWPWTWSQLAVPCRAAPCRLGRAVPCRAVQSRAVAMSMDSDLFKLRLQGGDPGECAAHTTWVVRT